MSPRQKTALKNLAPGDLQEGESNTFDSGVDDVKTSEPSQNSPTLTAKQLRKKRGVPKKEESEQKSRISPQPPLSSPPLTRPLPTPPKHSQTIDSTPTTSKEFIDSLTDSVGRNALQLVAKTKGRSQQLTFDALIKGATKLELCSLKENSSENASRKEQSRQNEQNRKVQDSPGTDSGLKKSASGKNKKKNTKRTPTVITTDEAVEKMESALKGLGKLEGEVMNALFPTDGSLPQSYELIATRFGMSVEEVKGIADNALRGLRGVKGPNGRISTVWN